MDKIMNLLRAKKTVLLIAAFVLISTTLARAEVAPMPVVSGNELSWPAVDSNSINVHRGDGTYLATLPGNATSWTAPASGTYYLVATTGSDWRDWLRSQTVTVGMVGPTLSPMPVVTGNQLDWSAVAANAINVHSGDGSYVTTLRGIAISWTAPAPGDYYLVATMDGDWRNWLRSPTVTVAAPPSRPMPVATGNQLNWTVVTANTINVHRDDGTYVTTLPGNATSWTAAEPGGYYLIATTDGDWTTWPRSDTVEVGENPNNGPDLIVSDLRVTSVDPAGSLNIVYSYTVRNIGNADAFLDDVSVQTFLSQDVIFENSDDSPAGGRVITTESGIVLAPGEEVSGTFQSTTQVNPEEFTFLTMKVDWNEVLTETNELNNTIASWIPATDDTTELQARLELVTDKTFSISWQPSTSADYYRVLENPDGVSGFTQILDDLDPSTQRIDHRVALYNRINARYIVQACTASGCIDSEEQIVSGSLERAIGYFKASNTQDGFGNDSIGQPGEANGDRFGTAVSLSADGNTMAIGANWEDSAATGVNGDQNDNSASNSGAVYVFVRRNGNWQQQAYLKSGNTSGDGEFGASISLSADGNTLAVGAPRDSFSGPVLSGAVFVFARSDEEWQQKAFLKAGSPDTGDGFGRAISLNADGNTLAVGATGEKSNATGINGDEANNDAVGTGAAYVFALGNGNWQQQAYIKATINEELDFFGSAISLSAVGDTLAVGAWGEDSASTGTNGDPNDNSELFAGAVYIFVRNNENWQQRDFLKSNIRRVSFFGRAVSLSADGSALAVGAPQTGGLAGAVHVFAHSGGNWQEQFYVTGRRTGQLFGQKFGSVVSLSADGNTLAFGATGEDSLATGINGDQNNESALNSGAAYVYARDNGNWLLKAYLKASNAQEDDLYGTSVSLSADGNSLAVGAIGEDSFATGVYGNQDDNSALGSGAVYLY